MVIMDTLKSSKRESLDCWRGNLGVGPSKDKKIMCRENCGMEKKPGTVQRNLNY